MIIFEKNKPTKFTGSDSVGVVGEQNAFREEFFIKGLTDRTIDFTIYLRFANGLINILLPDSVKVGADGTTIVWNVKKDDIFMHGYFELQLEGRKDTVLIFQTKIIRLYADDSIPIEDERYKNPNTASIQMRDETYALLDEIKEQNKAIAENAELIKNSNVLNKADKTYVDGQLNLKENKLKLSVAFDDKFNPLTVTDSAIIGAGSFASGNKNIATAFVSGNVTQLQNGAFYGCTNLTDIYIDNTEDGIAIQSGAVPDGVTVHYADDESYRDFNEYAVRAILSLNSSAKKLQTDIAKKSEIVELPVDSISSAEQLNGYTDMRKTYLFYVVPNFANQLGVSAGTLCTLNYYNNYQILKTVNRLIEKTFLRRYQNEWSEFQETTTSSAESLLPEINSKANQTDVDDLSAELENKLDNTDNSVKENNLNNYSVSTRTIQPGAVKEAQIADMAIKMIHINPKCLDDEPSASSGMYHDGNCLITSRGVHNALQNKLDNADNSVNEKNLNNYSVSTRTIQPGAVKEAQIAEQIIRTSHINPEFLDDEPSASSGMYHDGNCLITSRGVYNALLGKSGVFEISDISSSEKLNDYTDMQKTYLFYVVPGFANQLGVSAGTLCTLNYYNNYQILRTVNHSYEKTFLRYYYQNEWSEFHETTPTANYETGPFSNYIATYDSNSTMSGSYTLMGNLCFVTATAAIKGGWGDIDYSLPVAALNDAACLATDGSKSYRVSTSTENSHVYIHRVEEGATQADGTISFTLIYKYK